MGPSMFAIWRAGGGAAGEPWAHSAGPMGEKDPGAEGGKTGREWGKHCLGLTAKLLEKLVPIF